MEKHSHHKTSPSTWCRRLLFLDTCNPSLDKEAACKHLRAGQPVLRAIQPLLSAIQPLFKATQPATKAYTALSYRRSTPVLQQPDDDTTGTRLMASATSMVLQAMPKCQETVTGMSLLPEGMNGHQRCTVTWQTTSKQLWAHHCDGLKPLFKSNTLQPAAELYAWQTAASSQDLDHRLAKLAISQ